MSALKGSAVVPKNAETLLEDTTVVANKDSGLQETTTFVRVRLDLY